MQTNARALPIVLLLLDYWPLNRFAAISARRLLLEKLPFLALGLAACASTLLAQTLAIGPLTTIPLKIRLDNSATSIVTYLQQMVWPVCLSPFYPFTTECVSFIAVGRSLLILLALSALILVFRRRKYPVVGWLWFLVMLAPVIGIVQVGQQAHADRYTYLPHLGLYLGITWAAADLASRRRLARLFLGALAAMVLAASIVTARAQVAYWQNSQSLWMHALSCTPDNAMVRRSLAHALHEKGQLEQAVAEYERSLALDPAQPLVQSSIGVTLLELGRKQEAVAHLEEALRLDPKFAGAYSNLGLAMFEVGRIGQSVTYLEQAIAIDPDLTDAQYNLANTYLETGRARDALTHYQKAVELDPDDARALNNMAWILATWSVDGIRDGGRAIELAARADILTHGESPVIKATLAAAYAETGRFDAALNETQRALDLAIAEGNRARADSIRAQIDLYKSGAPFRDPRHPQ